VGAGLDLDCKGNSVRKAFTAVRLLLFQNWRAAPLYDKLETSIVYSLSVWTLYWYRLT